MCVLHRVTSTTSNNITYYHHQLTYEFLKRLNTQLQYQQYEEDAEGLSWHMDPTKPKKKHSSTATASNKDTPMVNALTAGRRCHKLVVFGLMHAKLCKASLNLLDVSCIRMSAIRVCNELSIPLLYSKHCNCAIIR